MRDLADMELLLSDYQSIKYLLCICIDIYSKLFAWVKTLNNKKTETVLTESNRKANKLKFDQRKHLITIWLKNGRWQRYFDYLTYKRASQWFESL